jgi:hypothetical protein
MVESRVVDTNVLIVASAADETSPFQPEATPVEEAEFRSQILDWLTGFEADNERHAVLDNDWKICGEYQNKLTDQDYGFLAIMAKLDRKEVEWVQLDFDENGHAVLPDALKLAIKDLEDRKMVAAALAATADGHHCIVTNACDTDWLDWAEALKAHGVETEHLIEDWLRRKWLQKQSRQ